MFRIGIKMGPARNKEWTCMFGMHVRSATIIIGLWHLVILMKNRSFGLSLDYNFYVPAIERNGAWTVGCNHSEPRNDSQS